MSNIHLFLTSSIIWGTTWIMITFQLGVVAPMVSVAYRFFLASLILFGFCWLKRKTFNFSLYEHWLIFIQGLMLFGLNYWFTYLGIEKINSALAAILSTTIVYMNVVFARIFLGDRIKVEVLVGATIGIIGVILIFLPELKIGSEQTDFQTKETWMGIWIILFGGIFASIGNIISAKTQRRKIPVVQANALGMGYASIFFILLALLNGHSLNFEMTFSYIASLIYLALFGSVIAFGAFLTLIGNIGPDKAGYVTLVYPVIAMVVSTFFEDYQWTMPGFLGLLIILIGNFIAMGKYKSFGVYQKWLLTRSQSTEC